MKASSFAAGYDIFSSENNTVFSNKSALTKTDISVQPHPGTYI